MQKLLAAWLLTLVSACTGEHFPISSEAFDSARWVAEPHSRASMAEDLIANHLRTGMTKSEVADLLGLDASQIGRNRSEDIGGWGWCCYLDLEFDESELLAKAFLNPY